VLEILAPGLLTTVQDLGRGGQAHLGVGTSGACDREALRRANRLVANEEAAAGLEITFGGFRVRARQPLTVAVTGAPGAVTIDGVPAAMATALRLQPGAELAIGTPPVGLRTYVAVHGGVDTPDVLGSRSSDLLAGLGPPPLKVGDLLGVSGQLHDWTPVDVAPGRPIRGGDVELRVMTGPRADWFTAASVRRMLGAAYVVTPDSNRVGLRLDGPRLTRVLKGELPSEGLLPGAIQVPPPGEPVLLLADHPVTGGYPVVLVVRDADLDVAAQLRPGQGVRLKLTTNSRL